MSASLFVQSEEPALKVLIREIPEINNTKIPLSDTSTSNTVDIVTSSISVSTSNVQSSVSTESSSSITSDNTTYLDITTQGHHHGAAEAGTAIAIILVLVLVAAFLALIYCYMRKKGKLNMLSWFRPSARSRRSSTSSSRRALEEHEVMDNNSRRPKPDGQDDDKFTIDEFENATDPTNDPNGGRGEEYYYDEVFGQSQFEDEATNNAMRHLYSDNQTAPEEEMLDLDFETLGIKIEDYSPNTGRKNNA